MIIGANSPKKEDKLDYINLEANPSPEQLENSFLDWVKDKSYFKNYSKVNLIKHGAVLLRLYRYEEINTSILNIDGEPLKMVKILPYLRVIKSYNEDNGIPGLKAGDIVYGPDLLTSISTNPTWLQWSKIMKDERPIPEGLPEPEKITGLLLEWRKTSRFCVNKLNPTEDDNYTFIRQETEFYVKYL